MSKAEALMGKSLDDIIAENSKLAGGMRGRSGRGGARAPARSVVARGSSAAASSKAGGGRRVPTRTSRLTGIAGLGGARTGGGRQQAVIVGNTRYVKAQVPGVSNAGVSKAGGGRKRVGGGGAAAAFAHDDRTGKGGFADDDSYGMGGGGGGGAGSRMGSRLQGGAGAGSAGRWQHDMYDPHEPAAVAPRRAGRLAGAAPSLTTRVLISNLDFKVTKQDLEELFMPIGKVLSATIDYDRTDRHKGTGQVVFQNRKDAEQALSAYNGVKLDNRALQLSIDDARVQVLSSGKSVEFPGGAPARGASLASRALQQAVPRQSAAPARSSGRGRGGSRLRSVVGGGRVQRSANELNAELDDYMQE